MKNYNQEFKIFGRKVGRKTAKNINKDILNQYLLNKFSALISKKIILDIGSGNGENSLLLSYKYSDHLIIASDIYQDGNINLCTQLYNKKINNVKIFDQNVLVLFKKFNLKNLLKEIWVLFPDPWPKKKHYKRRLINLNFIKKVSFLLEGNSKIYIVTDCTSYFISILKDFYDSKSFEWLNNTPNKWDYSLNVSHKTKYFTKAKRNNKKSFILIFQKI